MNTFRRRYWLLLVAIIATVIWVGCQAAAARPQVSTTPRIEYGVVDSGVIPGPGSTAVTGTFAAAFEESPVCTLAQRPGTVGTAQKTESAAATLIVVLMNVTVNDVTVFINNPNAFPDSTLIHWHYIGQ